MWGLGLFFSVQFTFQFGLFGLLCFAVPNAIGLFLFGAITAWLARREAGSDSLDPYFARLVRPFRLVFFLYQLLAVTLTMFALLKYLFAALDLSRPLLVLPLALLIMLAAACLFGEEFNIRRIKYSHGVLLGILVAAVAVLLTSLHPWQAWHIPGTQEAGSPAFWGLVVPIVVGLFIGPWLDLQQWQRAIQIQKEKTSITLSYFFGAGLFFLLLLFHGTMTLWALGQGAAKFSYTGIDGLAYGHEIITRLFNAASWTGHPVIPWAYFVFLGICALTTLDSGYLALRWFLKDNLKDYNNALLNLIPNDFLVSPIPSLVLGGVFALAAAVIGLELEYFMVFYATFFVGYGAMLITRCFNLDRVDYVPQIRLFSMGSLAVVIFAYGYFLRMPGLLVFGSLLPLGYILWLIFGLSEEKMAAAAEAAAAREPSGLSPAVQPALPGSVLIPAESTGIPLTAYEATGEYFEGKWFVHTFRATYADTNSTGNVYFGMYAMWVGKARELFFHKVLGSFDLRTSPYYILTRSFEHKFIRETREFEKVSVKIRIADYNRKFVTLEHQIFDSGNHLLGKGQQSLLFVSSKDYALLDIPQDVVSAFISYA